MAEETENPEKSLPPKVGVLIREARIAAGVEAADLCASLRISTAALQALESGHYNRLPGEPYVRALLGSIARYLGLDPQRLLHAYNLETGIEAPEPLVAPYEDVSRVHILAHRKLFITLLAVLLLALLVILARINSSGKSAAVPAAPAPVDSTASNTTSTAMAPVDSIPESAGLQPDSIGKLVDSSVKNSVTAKPAQADTVRPKIVAAKAADTVAAPKPAKIHLPPNRVKIKAILGVSVFRLGSTTKREEVQTLGMGRSVEISGDTVTVIQRRTHSVEVSFGDTTFVPKWKRFKIADSKVIYF